MYFFILFENNLLLYQTYKRNLELYEYKEFVANQLYETTKYNSKLAVAKYYQQKYNEIKQRNLKNRTNPSVQSVCVKYV